MWVGQIRWIVEKQVSIVSKPKAFHAPVLLLPAERKSIKDPVL